MRHGDAFAGIGGFGLAARRAGLDTVWAAEIEPSARSVYSARLGHPGLRFDSDITQSRDLPQFDVLTGGFPCQDLSIAGAKKGLAGARSGLFFELDRILGEVRPEWFVLENVPGLLSSNKGRDMGVVLSTLVERGYGVCYRILNAQFFGVAQRRRRVFLVGHRSGDPRRAAEVLFEPEGVRRDSAPVAQAGRDVAYALAARTHKGGDPTTDQYVVGALQGGGKRGYRIDAKGARDNQLIATYRKSHRASSDTDAEIWRDARVADTLNTHGFSDIRATTLVIPSVSDPISTVEGKRWTAEGCTFRMVNAFPVVGAPSHAAGVRNPAGVPGPLDLCPTCQEGPDSPRYRGLGNAVAVPVVEWLLKRIVAASQSA